MHMPVLLLLPLLLLLLPGGASRSCTSSLYISRNCARTTKLLLSPAF
jgi:hypothetical protein